MSTIEVRLYGDLGWFCPDVDRDGVVRVTAGERRSVKDLVESLGVPHVEVGGLLVEGEPAAFDVQVDAGDRVAVYPVGHELTPSVQLRPPPPDPPRFVADVHLGTLARRLRLLGFDTWYDTDADDAQLAQRSVSDDRILLSRDRGLLMRKVVVHGYCPRSSDPDEQLTEVVARFDLAGRTTAFTRCAACNGRLEPVAKQEVLEQLPPATRREHDTFVRCDRCRQVYWPGTHVDALRDRFGELFDEV